MSDLRSTWRAMRPARSFLAIGGIAVAVSAGSIVPVGGVGGVAATPALSTASRSSALTDPGTQPILAVAGADPVLGTDGRFTILLLGSDYRPSHPGNRTDAIMVVSVDPASGKSAAFSIPRDTLNFPLPSGGVFGGKVNGLYQHFLSTSSTTTIANNAMKRAIEKAFKIELDGFVFIGFDGVRRMVDAVGGVTVVLDKPYYDPFYSVNARSRGWGLPAGKSHLTGKTALIFARSRKGDNDFNRTRRQQLLVKAALDKVRAKGLAVLPKLIRIAADTVRTDLSPKRVAAVFAVVKQVNLGTSKQVVFGPRTYTHELGGSAFSLDLAICRAWIARNFPPIHKNATWPPKPRPAPTPTPTPAPTGPGPLPAAAWPRPSPAISPAPTTVP